MARKELIKAVGYLRTSSAANVGPDKDSEKRQRVAIDTFVRSAGFEVVEYYYDADAWRGPREHAPRLRGHDGAHQRQRGPDHHCRDR